MVESTALEMRRTREGIVGSNPTLSASGQPVSAGLSSGGAPLFFPPRRKSGDFRYPPKAMPEGDSPRLFSSVWNVSFSRVF